MAISVVTREFLPLFPSEGRLVYVFVTVSSYQSLVLLLTFSLSVQLFVILTTGLSVGLFVCLFVCQLVCLSVSLYLVKDVTVPV